MLPENTEPEREKSALKRRIDMGLNSVAAQVPESEIDVEQFMVEEPGDGDEDESDDE